MLGWVFTCGIRAQVRVLECVPFQRTPLCAWMLASLMEFRSSIHLYIALARVVFVITGPFCPFNCLFPAGLDYVAEYRDPRGEYEPGYLCMVCECRLSAKQLVNHITDSDHRMRYMVGIFCLLSISICFYVC